MKNIPIKGAIPYVAAIVLFVVLSLAFLSPLLEGKVLRQDDTIRFKGMSKEISDFREATGEEPLWTNAMFSGMPAYQISTKYKANLTRYIDKIFRLGLPHPADMVFLYMLGFFILLVVLGVNPWLAIVGSIAYGFSSYFLIILEAGHNSKAHAIGYMAPALAGMILAYRGKYLPGGILTLLFLSLEIRAGHPQITYYLMLLVLVLGITEFVGALRTKTLPHFLKATGILVVVAVIAVLTHITNLWATYEYGNYSIRGKSELTSQQENRTSGLDKDYATQWSYGIAETGTLIIPNFHGGASNGKLSTGSNTYKALIENNIPRGQAEELIRNMPTYWGTQPFTSGPVYIGAIVMFLFVFGLILIKGNFKWWLLAGAILSVLLAWGKNFMPLTDFFLMYFPGYNKFRAVSMTLVIAELAIPILAFVALNEVFKSKKDDGRLLRALKLSLYITGGFVLLFILLPGLFFGFESAGDAQLKQAYPEWLIQAIMDDRQRILRLDAFRSLVFIVLSAAVIWAFVKGKLKSSYAIGLLALFTLVDMWTVGKRYLTTDDFVSKSKVERPYPMSKASEVILKDKDPNYRVMNFTVDPFADASTSYYHKSIGGYHGAKLRRYQELYDHYVKQNFNLDVLNMLNTKYFIQPDNNNRPSVLPNSEAFGNAWFVQDYLMVEDADEEIDALGKVDLETTAVIDKRFKPLLEGFAPTIDSTAAIKLIEYAPNHLTYQANTSKDQLVVFSEIYYKKGWNAYFDGTPVPHFRVNYVLRGMVLPAGRHLVEFKFEPKVYRVGERISFASSLLVILLVVGYGFYEIRKYITRGT
jgi:hypothetical protein